MSAKQLIANLKKLGANADKAIAQGVYMTAQQVRSAAVASIQAQSAGETVTRFSQGGNEYTHVASAPGDAPNTDTGSLVRSIAVEPAAPAAEMFVGSGIDYALFLELGTTKMKPRPWLMPAIDANRANLNANIAKAVNRMVQNVGK
jgi:HK97 gp10 family phage protein